MNSIKIMAIAGLALFVSFGVNALTQTAVMAHTDEIRATTAANHTPATEQAATGYLYVAQSGDSYSLLARKAVQTYGLVNKVELSLAQVIAAETNLTQAAGSPQIAQGQTVAVPIDATKKAVEAAKTLSVADQAGWKLYVPLVNFNTSAVGESR